MTSNKSVPPFGRLTVNAGVRESGARQRRVRARDRVGRADHRRAVDVLGSPASDAVVSRRTTSFGVNEPGTKWGLAEGRAGTARGFQTYILIGNTTDDSHRPCASRSCASGGGDGRSRTTTIAANSRFTVDVSAMVPELAEPGIRRHRRSDRRQPGHRRALALQHRRRRAVRGGHQHTGHPPAVGRRCGKSSRHTHILR